MTCLCFLPKMKPKYPGSCASDVIWRVCKVVIGRWGHSIKIPPVHPPESIVSRAQMSITPPSFFHFAVNVSTIPEKKHVLYITCWNTCYSLLPTAALVMDWVCWGKSKKKNNNVALIIKWFAVLLPLHLARLLVPLSVSSLLSQSSYHRPVMAHKAFISSLQQYGC